MASQTPILSVIMPVLNEGKTIRTIIENVQAVDIDKEIIVVNDGSTDDTSEIIRSMDCSNIILLEHPGNMGKGKAIQTAIPRIQGEYAIIQDGDLEYDPQDYIRLIDEIRSRNADVVYGSRILSHSRMSYFRYWLGGRGVTFFTNLLFNTKLTDEPTCYKLFRTSLLKSLNVQSTGFEFCPEVTAKILKRKLPIYEIPISYNPRSIDEGKKIRWKDGFIALWVLFRIRFSRRR